MRNRIGPSLATKMKYERWQNLTTGQTNTGNELGTVGIYLAAGTDRNNLRFLAHRRAMWLRHGGKIATPGGAMDTADYYHRAGWAHTEEAFYHAARQAARR
eukprot:16069357-Heterocapsa_arctica.AAC.1